MVKLIASGAYNDFFMDYMDSNRSQLSANYPTYDVFDEKFYLSDKEMTCLVDIASTKGVVYDEAGYLASCEFMRNQLSAMIAQRLFGSSAFYRWINPRMNEYYQKALSLLENWEQQCVPILTQTSK